LDAWAGTLDIADVAATADQTHALLVALCRTFADKLDPIQLRCLEAAGVPRDARDAAQRLDHEQIFRRIGQETPRIMPEARLPAIVHLPANQARNRLLFAACVAEEGPLDWQLAEYLPIWAEDAEIPIAECVAVFRAYVPKFGPDE
jgi:hypothetical protein